MRQTLTIIRPDDWHVHLRDGTVLRTVLPHTASVFARAIVMPNLALPVTTTVLAVLYRNEIDAALPPGMDFTPLMTLYLTDETDANDLEQGWATGAVAAAKLYPQHATTNSAKGVSDVKKISRVLERMQLIDMPLLVHGEATDAGIDVFDREAIFIDQTLIKLRREFPRLRVVFEHITTEQAAQYVSENSADGTLAATITAHHLLINRNAMFSGGLRPHYYCLPVAKREKHRRALVAAATSGKQMFFLGTDTAPHLDQAKETACGCAGVFSAPHALAHYAQCFDDAGKLENLEAFASRNGPAFYNLPVNGTTVTLEKLDSPVDIKSILTENGQTITSFVSPSPLYWQTVSSTG